MVASVPLPLTATKDRPKDRPSSETGEGKRRHAGPRVNHFKLDNGMDVVVIPDHRAPVVTHMVWYRNGSADDPRGKSGIAHFLEHLMFKGTHNHKQGEFSHLVAELGGQENAFTSYDYTAYFQRVAREHLGVVMEFEADRMTNLDAHRRDCRAGARRGARGAPHAHRHRSRRPARRGDAAPRCSPIIPMACRSSAGAMRSRRSTVRTRSPITAASIRRKTPFSSSPAMSRRRRSSELARETYGKIPARGEAPVRNRPREPEPRAERMVKLADEKVEQPQLRAHLSGALRAHGATGRGGGARRARPSSGRRPDQPALSQAGAGEEAGGHRPAPIISAPRSTTAASVVYAMPAEGVGAGRAGARPRRRHRRTQARRRERARTWPAPRPGWSPTRSMRRTTRRRWRAGSARRWPMARRSRTCCRWSDRIEAVTPKTSPRRSNGWSAAAPSPASCSRKAKPPETRVLASRPIACERCERRRKNNE